MRLVQFSRNLFNALVVWSNADVRRKEGAGDVLAGLDNRFVVEWVSGGGANGEDGWVLGDDLWGRMARCLRGKGNAGAKVWFRRV